MRGQLPMQDIGRDYQLPLAEAVFWAVMVVVVFFMLKAGLLAADSRRHR